MPEIKEPNKKISNDRIKIPKSEVKDPLKPAKFPTNNPNLLLVDCIKFERMGELAIEPTIIKEIGKVA